MQQCQEPDFQQYQMMCINKFYQQVYIGLYKTVSFTLVNESQKSMSMGFLYTKFKHSRQTQVIDRKLFFSIFVTVTLTFVSVTPLAVPSSVFSKASKSPSFITIALSKLRLLTMNIFLFKVTVTLALILVASTHLSSYNLFTPCLNIRGLNKFSLSTGKVFVCIT